MAELTLGALRAAAEDCAAGWGRARVAALGLAGSPRFGPVFARWPLLATGDALALALETDAEAPGLAAWIAGARVRAAVAPYAQAIDDLRWQLTVRVPGGPVVAWGDVPDRLAALAGDPATRHALGAARARLAADELAPLARERAARTRDAVEALGVAGGYDATVSRLTGVGLDARRAAADAWLAATEAAWADTLAERARRVLGVPARGLRAADLPALLAGDADEHPLRGGALVAAVRTQLTAMGLDPDAGGRVRTNAGRAADGRGARAVAVRVPGSVYVTAGTGVDAEREALDALGRALHLAHADPERPFEARWVAGAADARATGAVLGALLRDRGWVQRYAGIGGAARDRAVRGTAFRELAAWRAAAARAAVTAAAYGDAVPLGELDAAHADRYGAALGVAPDPGDAGAGLDAPFGPGEALRGALRGGALGDGLRERFDEDWWRNPRAGAWLRTEWFARSGASAAGAGAGGETAPAAWAPDGAPLAGALSRALQ